MSPRLKKAFEKFRQEYEEKSGHPLMAEDAFEFGYVMAWQAGAIAYNHKMQNAAIEQATDEIIESWKEGPLT